jgi:hypothetical protein
MPVISSYVGGGDCLWASLSTNAPRQRKFVRPHFNGKKLSAVVHACHPSNSKNLKIGRSWSTLVWAKEREPISKITRAKRARWMAQAVECLPSKHKAGFKPQYHTHTHKIYIFVFSHILLFRLCNQPFLYSF